MSWATTFLLLFTGRSFIRYSVMTCLRFRSFRFSEQDLGVARQFDAILHGGYVSMLRRLIDSISSRHGYFIEHGCGCENHLAKLKPCDTAFDYQLPAATRRKTLRAFFWSVMEEYLLFEQRAATKLVYADSADL